MPDVAYRVLKHLKKNAFLVGTYLTFFWVRMFDYLLGMDTANAIVWSILWLTPFVYIEPTIKSTFIIDYWVKSQYLLFVEFVTIVFMTLYLCFVKFVVYGTLITVEEVILLLCISALYHIIETIRKIEEWRFFVSLNAVAFFFAIIIQFLVLLTTGL